MRKVLIPGTFDPITSGHLDVIARSATLFDEVVVGVAASKNKKGRGTLFTLEERVALAKEATAGLEGVEVLPFENLLVDFATSIGAAAIVKGLRVITDFETEFQMAALNYRLQPELETIFVMSAPEHMYISSSVAREIASLGGRLDGMVPPCVERALAAKFAS